MYHDVISNGDFDSSGFPSMAAATYKLDRMEFERHLKAIARVTADRPPVSVYDILEGRATPMPSLLTFDDGGASAYSCIADMLEDFGWRGHFFIIAERVGTPSFLSAAEVRSLRDRGHIIGTHSWSHPTRMSHCTWKQLLTEWSDSVKMLSDLLGERVTIASVPGGYYCRKVAEAAARVGIKALFTSEPATRCYHVNGCLVLGRYTLRRWTQPRVAAALASAKPSPLLKQWLDWNTKKVVKCVGGKLYLAARSYMLERDQVLQQSPTSEQVEP
jgi:peptidoglycan/xylan/chitin deacetylase (PgdA/CDA1 family)